MSWWPQILPAAQVMASLSLMYVHFGAIAPLKAMLTPKSAQAIKESWGGLPYLDLVNGFEYIKESMDYVDTDRAVALGASYGGYMMNWMQGHALGKEFKGTSDF